jgi:hypothetical protein
MDAIVEKVYVDIPKSDLKFFKELIEKMGWEVHVRKSFLDKYIETRPKNVDLTDDEIMAEVNAVRYGEK